MRNYCVDDVSVANCSTSVTKLMHFVMNVELTRMVQLTPPAPS